MSAVNTAVLDTSAPKLPFVSVLMPVRNEVDFIERSLGSVLKQDYPHNRLEVIVADGESDDGTLDRVNKTAFGTDISIKIVKNPKKIAPCGLNAAIAEARGEIFVRVDGHCEIEPDYVANCVKPLTAGVADGVGGPIETIGIGPQAEAIAIAMSSKFGVGGSAFRTESEREMYTDTVAFPGYTREIVERAGPFNEELVRNQDDEYNFRIRKLDGRILLSPDIRSKYYSRSTFKSLWSQYFQYGYWKVRVFQLYPRQMSVRHFVPLAFVVSLIVAGISTFFPRIGAAPLVALICVYLAANLGAAVMSCHQKIAVLPYLSLSFAILHIAYGFGFLVGLSAFSRNWLPRARRQRVGLAEGACKDSEVNQTSGPSMSIR